MRTIIDILRKGNQELFHSYMIAWLMNPKSDHGLGSQFLEGFADKLSNVNHGTDILINSIKDHNPIINTEVKAPKSRYDIVVKIEDNFFVIENKTKSLGDEPQFKKYEEKPNTTLIALGFCEYSYSPAITNNYPVITYRDVLQILNTLETNETNDFNVLLKHYIDFLERELGVLDLIRDYCYGDINAHSKFIERTKTSEIYNNNDLRFMNRFYLESLNRYIIDQEPLKHSIWRTSKDARSGAIMWNRDITNSYQFLSEYENLRQLNNGELYFQIDLKEGLFAENLNDPAGYIQLRASNVKNNETFFREFKNIYNVKEGQQLSTSVKDQNKKGKINTFLVVRRNITKNDLILNNMYNILVDFMESFGKFSIGRIATTAGGISSYPKFTERMS